MKEAKTVLHTKTEIDGEEQEVLVMPITRLDCIEDTADVIENAAKGDYIPIIDSSNDGQMKKISIEQLFSPDSPNAQGTSITVDDALSSTSINPIQNKVVKAALDGKFAKTGGTISGNTSVTGNLSATGTITATGNITGAKVYNAVWNADYSEGFNFEGDIPEPGKIVELCGDNRVRTAAAGSDMVIGVCSNTYWALAGCAIADIENKTKVAVGIAGQLPIRVRGAVKYGDYIVCGGDGIGEARSKPSAGQVVGRAMESNASLEIKDVNCIIQIR